MAQGSVAAGTPGTSAPTAEEPARQSGKRPRLGTGGRLLLLAYAISGAAALVYEIAWMRELGALLGSTAYASGTMLSAFMAGLGIGSLAGARLARTTKHPLRDAARAELAVAAASVIALLGIRFLPGVFFDALQTNGVSATGFFVLQFAVSFAVMLLPTIAMGLTYPLIMEAVGKRSSFGHWAGMLYTTNTFGGIVGSLATGFVLIPLMGSKWSLLVAAALSFCAAAVLADLGTKSSGAPSFWRSFEPLVAAVAIVAVALIPAPPAYSLGVTMIGRLGSSAAYEDAAKVLKTLYDNDGVYSRVSVLEAPDGTRFLRNGALIEGSNYIMDRRTPVLLASMPAASAEHTASALVVGLGTGFTPQALLDVGLGHVTTVEINPSIAPASNYFVGESLTSDPRWELVVDDARSHILTHPEKYDVITSEPSWPLSASVAPLFTKEFMTAAKSRLNPGGVFCQWLPRYLLQEPDVRMMYKTMHQVFPRVDVWSINAPGMPEGEILLIGSQSATGPSVDAIAKRTTKIAGGLDVTPDAFSPYSDRAGLERAVSDPSVPINVDDHPRLAYIVIWNLLRLTSKGK
jgi:spermidine synthase